ncbi:uncharacterized protein [Palaemon carinicauda]|uniref:uncharacterized protein n=1 Tax=Palaemon carinicauda TaxID=392227 RepID=UPI0035B623C6
MAVATIVHIEASMGLIADLLVETQRALVETYSESVYQNLVTQLREEERQLRELYKTQSVKLEPGIEARMRHTLGEATGASTLLYNRIDRVKVTPTGNVSLPRLKLLPLPTFETEVQEYASYRELFKIHVDRRADLDDVSKFTYLLVTLGRDPLRIIKRLSSNDIGHGMVMSLINQKLSEGKLYRKVVEHLRKCDYTLD